MILRREREKNEELQSITSSSLEGDPKVTMTNRFCQCPAFCTYLDNLRRIVFYINTVKLGYNSLGPDIFLFKRGFVTTGLICALK
jgi:hypothetical protein